MKFFTVANGFSFLQSIISVHLVVASFSGSSYVEAVFSVPLQFLKCVLKIVKFFFVPWWQLVVAALDIYDAHVAVFILFGQTVL